MRIEGPRPLVRFLATGSSVLPFAGCELDSCSCCFFAERVDGAGPGLQPLPKRPKATPTSCASRRRKPSPKEFGDLLFEGGASHVFVDWVWSLLGICSRTSVCLTAFIPPEFPARALHPRISGPESVMFGLCPRPCWRRWSGSGKPGARRRRRLRHLSAAYALLRVMVCTLNWLALGYPKLPPPSARCQAELSPEQSAVLDRLLKLILHFMDRPTFGASSLVGVRKI